MIVETLIEMRKKWENKGIQKGLQEGVQKGIIQTAIELLKEGSSVEFVAKVTKLPIREIEKLKKNLN